MPHLEDGTRVDALLNPHGVVSRMNVGQIIETHLGLLTWHERRRGRQVSYVVPPFAAVDTEELLRQMPKECPTGKAMLRDGKNGIPFECPVTVGIQYLLRLNHSPADKIAVRVPRLYNLFTQQAIRGRQLGGGQRFGEMESWALVTHDAPTLLRDIFTRRSDHLHANSAGCAVPETLRFVAIILRGIGVETGVRPGSKRWKPLADAPQSLGADTVRGLAFRWAADDEKRKWSRGEVTNSWPPFKSEKEGDRSLQDVWPDCQPGQGKGGAKSGEEWQQTALSDGVRGKGVQGQTRRPVCDQADATRVIRQPDLRRT